MIGHVLIVTTALGAATVLAARGDMEPAPSPTPLLQPIDTLVASGTFDVELTPVASTADAGTALGRMSMVKEFRGDLEGTSTGEMLTATTAVEGSAGYVALERVTGTLQGRRGTFVLQHTGTLDRSVQSLSITVVPDSGTGELEGIQGTFVVTIDGERHSYELRYSLPPPR